MEEGTLHAVWICLGAAGLSMRHDECVKFPVQLSFPWEAMGDLILDELGGNFFLGLSQARSKSACVGIHHKRNLVQSIQ